MEKEHEVRTGTIAMKVSAALLLFVVLLLAGAGVWYLGRQVQCYAHAWGGQFVILNLNFWCYRQP
jgi:hypothetical protein